MFGLKVRHLHLVDVLYTVVCREGKETTAGAFAEPRNRERVRMERTEALLYKNLLHASGTSGCSFTTLPAPSFKLLNTGRARELPHTLSPVQ